LVKKNNATDFQIISYFLKGIICQYNLYGVLFIFTGAMIGFFSTIISVMTLYRTPL
tara:strand:- start:392 stop:559 length:168 start_codon:yes stop_codon:yes gene_type:complete